MSWVIKNPRILLGCRYQHPEFGEVKVTSVMPYADPVIVVFSPVAATEPPHHRMEMVPFLELVKPAVPFLPSDD
jgi:hypothetical protein